MRVFWLIVCCIMLAVADTSAQVRCEAYMPSFFVDVDANGGLLNQQAKTAPLTLNYPNVVNPYVGKLSFSSGINTSADVELGYYITRNRAFGIGIGFMMSRQTSSLGLDTFHVEYKATDFKGNVFRQVVSTDHPISENINRNSINIPILLRYKKDISRKTFFTADGGLLYNIQLQNTWTTNANFNYEAIYEFTGSSSNPGTVYDNSSVPGSKDLIWTQSQVLKNNPGVNLDNYFATRNQAGYSIGLNEKTNKNSGSFNMVSGSLGYTLNAALNFRITRKVYFKFGGYYLAQNFNNTSQNNALPLTSKIIRNSSGQDIGVDYNSLINNIKTIQTNSYGITLGLKIYLSRNSLLDFD